MNYLKQQEDEDKGMNKTHLLLIALTIVLLFLIMLNGFFHPVNPVVMESGTQELCEQKILTDDNDFVLIKIPCENIVYVNKAE